MMKPGRESILSVLGILLFVSTNTHANDVLPNGTMNSPSSSDKADLLADISHSNRIPGRARWISGVVLTTTGGILMGLGMFGIISHASAESEPSNGLVNPVQEPPVETILGATLLAGSLFYLVPGIILWISGWKKMKQSKHSSVSFALPTPVTDPSRSTLMLKMEMTF